MSKKLMIIISCAAVAILLMIIGVFVFKSKKTDKSVIASSSSLSKVIEVSDLETIEYKYNSVVTQKDEDNPLYHVRYDGVVKMGIDFSAVSFEVDEKGKSITVTIPKATIQSVTASPVDYIFVKSKYETETISPEIQSLCNDDLKAKAASNDELFNRAQSNAENVIQGLIKPFVEGYSVKYNYQGGEES